ncbi:MAG TPA: ABC transporter ATP-binding protein [Burkholderiaceae bacterium]|nr:ABC transporter ATP-binding protein [Burkholderiaceae bacterium]
MTAGCIEARQVHIEVGDGPQRIEAVRNASFVVRPGEFVCLLGPSGCGKSTLLAALAGHLGTQRGTLTLDGRPIAGPDPQRGLVFQQHTLFPWKTVLDNVAFGLKMQGRDRASRDAEARAMLALVGLAGFESRYPSELSGGMQQRAEIARVLLNQPRVLMMDEPFGALDALTRARMQQQLLALWTRLGTTVVFVTHDIDEALFLADRLLIMSPRPGRIVEDLAVALPRPRTAELTTEAAFNALKRHCLAVLGQIEKTHDLAQVPAHDPALVRP